MTETALFTSPMARKKRVDSKYAPNSYRVISYQAESIPGKIRNKAEPLFPPTCNILGQTHQEVVKPSEHRQNRPNPDHVGFLRQDVRLLNEPVCDVYTSDTKRNQHQWWPSRTSKETLKVPPHTLDTTVRDDFQYRGQTVQKNTRHGANPNTVPALGSVPVNFMRDPNGKQRFWKEGFSYEHQYNCRLDPSYPIRGKRHGSFVWDKMHNKDVDNMLQSYGLTQQATDTDTGKSDTQSPKPSSPARRASGCSNQNRVTSAQESTNGTDYSAIAPVAV